MMCGESGGVRGFNVDILCKLRETDYEDFIERRWYNWRVSTSLHVLL